MARSFGEPLTKLRAVPIQENGEPLVDPRTLSKRIHFALKHPKFEDMPRTPRVRRRVAQMLAQAAESLPSGTDIQIIEGFRPLAQQRFMYEHLKAEFAQRHPEWAKATLHRITNTLSAPPDDPCPPPHSTGGAVDLCLIRVSTGERLDVTSPFEWDETSAPTRMRGLTPEAQANRDLLIQTLEATGLTNYTGEWWHWSYGDSGWALRVAAPCAVYDRLPESVT
jgi:D-alanyl-D-alanine dipeptidase